MEFNFEKNTVTIFAKSHKIDTLVTKLAALSGEQIYGFFSNRDVLIPRRLNCLALYSVLNNKLRLVNSNSFSKDYYERLKYYNYFTELQLFNLYKEIATYDDFFEYRKNLFYLILQNYVALNFKDGEIQYLINLKKLPVESFEQYFENVSCSCYEQDNTFDGQNINSLLETLEFSASTSEIYALAQKYGISLPTRLKKDSFIAYLYWYLEKENKLSKEIVEQINNMTTSELNELAQRENIGMSSTLTKGELVRYFFYVLNKYELPKTIIKRLEVPAEFNPVEFEVKLENATQFKTENPRKVLFFKGDMLDKASLEFEKELIDIHNDVKEDERYINTLVDQDIKNYELPRKEIKLVVNEVSKEDLSILKYSTIKGVDYKKTKALVKGEKPNVKSVSSDLEETIDSDDIEDENLDSVVNTTESLEKEVINETQEELEEVINEIEEETEVLDDENLDSDEFEDDLEDITDSKSNEIPLEAEQNTFYDSNIVNNKRKKTLTIIALSALFAVVAFLVFFVVYLWIK